MRIWKASKWLVMAGMVGVLTGSASALFLASLDLVTSVRLSEPWVLWLLPLGGAAISYLYQKLGRSAGGGITYIISVVYDRSIGVIPLRMAPMVLIGTLVTHLFGGSAGREGTAVQMGASLSEWIGQHLRLDGYGRRIILLCGLSSGFGSVFGTPLAGTLFGLEVLAIGVIRYEALLPCFIASLTGHLVTEAWGIQHAGYSIGAVPPLTLILAAKLVAASVLFGLTGSLFSTLLSLMKRAMTRLIANSVWRSFVGGVMIIGLVYVTGTREYLGLSLPLLERSFETGLSPLDFLLKLLYTVVTLGSGFQGGEVTPLFVIGSTLGSSLAELLSVSVPLLAAMGLIAVFCGAANTPLTCFVLGIELFGSEAMLYLFIGCMVSYAVSGHHGIYRSQQIEVPKHRLH
ncbi:voltage-gated chloride channel family protein [Paenibacillus sp. GCM10023252]|uniref:voltage-gated chloride channel family protein n=1 Tax=Paenibacillus sp. GCM10023252 TaxID=3252649 RepID=UPI0036194D14